MSTVDEKIKDWYINKNQSIAEIAKKLNISQSVVKKYLTTLGVAIRTKVKISKEALIEGGPKKDEIIQALKENDWKMFNVAKKLGVSFSNLELLMDHYQIPRKHKKRKEEETEEAMKKRLEAYFALQMGLEETEE